MPQSLAQIYVHLVFSTKGRAPWLNDDSFRAELHGYMNGICNQQDSPALAIGGTADHVHLLVTLGRSIALADLVREIKRDSTKWIKSENRRLARYHWQQGYGAFSISPSHVKAVTKYIDTQESHHRRHTFQEEFRRLCSKYELDVDERYAWD